MSTRFAPGALVIALGAILSACSAPPQKERDQAEAAIAAARAADAPAYALRELEAALTALKAYDTAVAQGDYRLALSQAIGARDNAYDAAKLAAERKAAARHEAERLLVDLEGLVIVARSRLASGPALAPQAAVRTRATVRQASSLLQEARSRIEKQDFKGVVTLLQPAVQALKKDVGPAAGRRGK